MGNASQQSKQKQQISKKQSQGIKKAVNIRQSGVDPTTNENRVYLGVQQAEIFKQLIQASNDAQAQLNFALTTAGFSNDVIVGGDLDSDSPYFIIKQESKQ
tara:strand:+ start:261 stop:563 length:303 start_codon:yes stop_codon:yes gene_type:complete